MSGPDSRLARPGGAVISAGPALSAAALDVPEGISPLVSLERLQAVTVVSNTISRGSERRTISLLSVILSHYSTTTVDKRKGHFVARPRGAQIGLFWARAAHVAQRGCAQIRLFWGKA